MTARVMTFVLLLLSAVAESATTAAVEAKLSVPFEVVPAGVPFDMTVTLKNTSQATVAVGIYARLRVTLSDGSSVSPARGILLEPETTDNGPNWIELAPGESREMSTSWQHSLAADHEWARFSAPGVYEIALELRGAMPPKDYVGPVTTTTARLTRAVSPGEDEELWRQMRNVPGGWSDDSFVTTLRGREILRDILRTHPGSAYYPFALLLEPQVRILEHSREHPTRDDIMRTLATAERFPNSPAYPHLLVLAGDLAASIGDHAWWQQDWRTAAEYFRLAEGYYSDALKKAPGATIRSIAQRGKDRARGELTHDELRPFKDE